MTNINKVRIRAFWTSNGRTNFYPSIVTRYFNAPEHKATNGFLSNFQDLQLEDDDEMAIFFKHIL